MTTRYVVYRSRWTAYVTYPWACPATPVSYHTTQAAAYKARDALQVSIDRENADAR